MNRLVNHRISIRCLSSFCSSNRLVVAEPVSNQLSPHKPNRRDLSHTVRTNKPAGDEELTELTGGDALKFIFSGMVGCVVIAYLIAICSQMPVDPERMTQEKQKNMTQDEMKAYEDEQKNKGYLQAIGEMFPAGWRWSGAAKIVWEHCYPSTWLGLKLGWDYYLSTKEPEWKVALPPPLGEGYPQTKYTITMEILDILFIPHFDPIRGWVFKKRKGAEYLMQKIGFPHSELVFYTEASPQDVQPVIQSFMNRIEKMTPKGENPPGSLYQLYRNSCSYEDGNYKKDLKILGRDQRFVIHLEVNDMSYRPADAGNVILVPRPSAIGEGKADMTLYDLADMLHSILKDSDVCDVRDKLKDIGSDNYGDPLPITYLTDAFRQKEIDEAFRQQEIDKEMEKYKEKYGDQKIPQKKWGRFL